MILYDKEKVRSACCQFLGRHYGQQLRLAEETGLSVNTIIRFRKGNDVRPALLQSLAQALERRGYDVRRATPPGTAVSTTGGARASSAASASFLTPPPITPIPDPDRSVPESAGRRTVEIGECPACSELTPIRMNGQALGFCGYCGQSLGVTCGHCGTRSHAGARYCPWCGASLRASHASASIDTP